MAETSGRLLALLSLLQTPREWPGRELADRLGVSQRTVRNDVDRLRRLGYPVEATRGNVGGYRLTSGTAMPPLLLDDDEAIAIAVALGPSASGAVAGLEETSMRAMAKLMQVLPKRLAGQVDAIAAHTERVSRRPSTIEVAGSLLALIGAAARDREILRFGYAAFDGSETERRVEPYRLVNWGRRWYLVAFDVNRDDWRTFRVDRMREARSVGHRFRARPLPAQDLAAYVADQTRQVKLKVSARVVVRAPAEVVQRRMGSWMTGAIEDLGDGTCRVLLGGRSETDIAFWLGILDVDFRIEDSPELAAAVRRLAARYAAAV